MHEDHPHRLLAQIPLTVSPFVSLPTATTLPYTYKSLPSTLPPSLTSDPSGSDKPKYVMSSTGHAAHPDEIIESCRALQAHLQKLQDDAERTLREWEEGIKERDLAEKRKIAPGWLDREEKILEPERRQSMEVHSQTMQPTNSSTLGDAMQVESSGVRGNQVSAGGGEGEELDRAFGGLGLR